MTNDSPPSAPAAPDGNRPSTSVVTTGTRIIGTYEVEKLINSGGMGEVYRGVNIHNGEPVAIKIVLASLAHDPKIVALFQKEATVLGRLAHEAIVRYHVFTNDPAIGRPCMVMEFVEGTSMSDRVEQGPMPLEDVRILFRRVASGLDKAHRAGVVHRDLSPDNVILEGGEVEHAKLIDFGIAKSSSIGGGTLLQGQFAGKFNWVSPEQLGAFGGLVDGRSDIYSLALLVAAASRGKVVDMGASIVDAVGKRASVPDLSGVDPALLPLLSWMLQPDPGLRPDSMAGVIAALDNPALIPSPATGNEPDPNRTVIGGSLPPMGLPPAGSQPPAAAQTGGFAPPPAPQATGGWQAAQPRAQTQNPATVIAPSSQPPYMNTSPPAAQFGQPQPVSAPPFQATGGPGIAPVGNPAEAEDFSSPFGAPSQPATPPRPEPAAAAPAAKGGGKGGLFAVLGAAAVAAAGAGLYFGGVFGPSAEDPAPTVSASQETPPTEPSPTQPEPAQPETAAEPQPQAADPQPVEPQPEPEPPEAQPPVQPAVEPEATPEPEPEPAADPVAQPETTPEPEQPALGPLERQAAWLNGYAQPDCTLFRQTGTAGDALALDGFATTTAPMEAMASAFEAAEGVKPDVAVRLVNETQCPVLEFAKRHKDGDSRPVQIVMQQGGATVKSGGSISGVVEGLEGRSVALFLVSEAGGATNLKQWVASSSDGQVSFNFTVSLAPGAPPAPQLLLALATDSPLTKLDAVPDGVTVRSLMPFVDVELSGEGQGATVGLGHFLLQN